MELIWRDENLKQHKIDLSSAVDVEINGIKVYKDDQGITCKVDDGRISVYPMSSNQLIISKRETQ